MSDLKTDELKIFCSKCKQKMDVSEFKIFATFPCPVCTNEIIVPKKVGKLLAVKLISEDKEFENYLGSQENKEIAIKVFKKTVAGSLGIKACLKMLSKEQPNYIFSEFKGQLIGSSKDNKAIEKLKISQRSTVKDKKPKKKKTENNKVKKGLKPTEKSPKKPVKVKLKKPPANSSFIFAGAIASILAITFILVLSGSNKEDLKSSTRPPKKLVKNDLKTTVKKTMTGEHKFILAKHDLQQRSEDSQVQNILTIKPESQFEEKQVSQEENAKKEESQRKEELDQFLQLINPPKEKLELFAKLPKVSSVHLKDLMKKHCTECHNERKNKGDLNLDIFNSDIAIYRSYEMIKHSYENVLHGDMPPDEDDLSDSDRAQLLTYLEKLIYTLESKPLNFKKSALIRRLTPYEYDNTIVDITGLDLKIGESFPADGGGNQGFINDAYVMGVSPILMEQYIEAAEQISEYSKYDINKGIYFTKNEEMADSTELFEDTLQKKIFFAKEIYPSRFSIENSLPNLMRAVAEFYFTTGKKDTLESITKRHNIHQSFIEKGYNYLTSSAGKSDIENKALKKWKSIKRGNVDNKKLNEAIKNFTNVYKASKTILFNRKEKDRSKHIPFIKNIEDIFILSDKEALTKFQGSQYESYKKALEFYRYSRFAEKPKDGKNIESYIKPHIRNFLYKVYRRPPTEQELTIRTNDFLNDCITYGIPVAAKILVIREFSSVNFVFRIEKKKTKLINDYDLASRLSYFLWAGPPDDELLSLASKGELNKENILLKQIDRMLRDKRSTRLAKHFANQWLKFGEIISSPGPDSELFSGFDPQLAKDMWQETAMCFNYIVKNDRSILEIIDADYTIINNRLSRIYGLRQNSSSFKKVRVDRKTRGGILGHASFLTMTSLSKRTSPIIRGNWVLTVLLGNTIPPPPMDVPDLPEEEVVNESFTLEQQLAKHRDVAACRGCHKKIDPLGIVLENYDPVGRWRDKYQNAPIVSSAEVEGSTVNGPADLKKHILKNKVQFIRNLSRKLVSYSLGRSIYFYDNFLVNQMIENCIRSNYKFSSLVKTIVLSPQFQHK